MSERDPPASPHTPAAAAAQ